MTEAIRWSGPVEHVRIPFIDAGDEQRRIAHQLERGRPGWFPFRDTALTRSVALRCWCGALATIRFAAGSHHITAGGLVTPSILASHCCGWHCWGTLEGWDLGEMG